MRQTTANLPSAMATHLISPQWDAAQCHNCAVVRKEKIYEGKL